jgi:SAM-dependent methyltransferase
MSIIKNSRLKVGRYKINKYIARLLYICKKIKEIELEKAFIGGEDIFSIKEWIDITGDFKRGSCLLKDSFYVDFLNKFKIKKVEEISNEEIKNTRYYENAIYCIRVTGHYFQARDETGVLAQAKNFLRLRNEIIANRKSLELECANGHSELNVPIVYKIFDSEYFGIFDGHHRLAISFVLGKKTEKVIILPPRKTYLQELVFKVKQTKSRKELYQPIESPEFGQGWHVIRKCSDRLQLMLDFLKEKDLIKKDLKILDLACAYGWFVSEFIKRGFRAIGVDKDGMALKVGMAAYGLNKKNLINSGIEDFINTQNEHFDIVLCLSLLHHYALGIEKCSVREILGRLDKITGRVLFVDSGQVHERWFKKSLSTWNDDFLINLIKENSNFKTVVKLGHDQDNIGTYKDNYARSLFACLK